MLRGVRERQPRESYEYFASSERGKAGLRGGVRARNFEGQGVENAMWIWEPELKNTRAMVYAEILDWKTEWERAYV